MVTTFHFNQQGLALISEAKQFQLPVAIKDYWRKSFTVWREHHAEVMLFLGRREVV